jgi:hypothetical protein
MRSARVLCVLGLVLHLAPRASAAQPASSCERLRDGDGLHLVGRIGAIDVRAYLSAGHPAEGDDGVAGAYVDPATWAPEQDAVSLEGTVDARCRLELRELNGSDAVWRLQLMADGLRGTRNLASHRADTIVLQVVPRPDCSGTGRWRRFSAAPWPMSFEYPESWRIRVTSDHVTLQCLDPSWLAIGGLPIRITYGPSPEDATADDGRSGTRIGRFVRFGDDPWLVGDSACEIGASEPLSAFCGKARHSMRGALEILQGEAGEHRLYRPGGGYLGQGPGLMSYAVITGRRWLAIDSEATLDGSDVSGPGAVVLGMDVTSRIARSVKPR